jgi:dynein heavy chain
MTLEALIVLGVHDKDVVEELINSNVYTIETFEWVAQMRYYITDRETFYPTRGNQIVEKPKYKNEHMEIAVKMVNTVRQYGFEYLGN